MAIPKKPIKELTPEEALKLTDDEVIQKIFGKKVLAELKRQIAANDAKAAKKKAVRKKK